MLQNIFNLYIIIVLLQDMDLQGQLVNVKTYSLANIAKTLS